MGKISKNAKIAELRRPIALKSYAIQKLLLAGKLFGPLYYNIQSAVRPVDCKLVRARYLFDPYNFYRTTRMHSADYAVARCLSVRLSVCLSHAGILSTLLNISSIFLPSGSPTILVFSYQTPTGTP